MLLRFRAVGGQEHLDHRLVSRVLIHGLEVVVVVVVVDIYDMCINLLIVLMY
jgi:hypothetical protein